MSETIKQIRELLSRLESEVTQTENAVTFRELSGLELPDIIKDVVDLLMPEITPYEVAIYRYLLRHSVIEKGTQHIRASTRACSLALLNLPMLSEVKTPTVPP